jgi:signal transduction histidine kinase
MCAGDGVLTYATATGEGPAGPEHRQAALAALGRQALRDLDPGALMAQATALIAETLETELTGVFEFSEDGASLILRAGAGWDEGSIDRPRLAAVGQAGSGRALSSKRRAADELPSSQSGLEWAAGLTERGVVSGIEAPIEGRAQDYGTLVALSTRAREFSDEDKLFLRAIANLLAIALHNRRTSGADAAAVGERASRLSEVAMHSELRTELERARAAALEASRIKSAFLANTSHEIRTPLNVILGYSDLIREHLKERGESALDAYLDAVRRAGQRLTHTIDQILDYSNIEAGTLELRPVEIALGPLLDSLGREFAALAAGKGLDFRVALEASDVVVRFDERCLKNALTSLLENAVKFTERGEIAVRLYRGAGDSFELEIRDTGVGIGSGYMTRLAEPFSQEESGEIRQFEGTGLGLALTYRYLKLNGADLTVKSVKGEGTTVTVRFASSV